MDLSIQPSTALWGKKPVASKVCKTPVVANEAKELTTAKRTVGAVLDPKYASGRPSHPQQLDPYKEPTLEIWVDASAKSNGKADASGAVGLVIPKLGQGVQLPLLFEHITNQRAELFGLICAVNWFRTHASSMAGGFKQAIVLSDSQYSVVSINIDLINWQRRNWRKSDHSETLNVDLWQVLVQELQSAQAQGLTIAFVWVKHSKEAPQVGADESEIERWQYNRCADLYAQDGVDDRTFEESWGQHKVDGSCVKVAWQDGLLFLPQFLPLS